LGGITIGQRRKILQEMAQGNGLSDAYTATIARLKAQKGNRPGLGLQALMWVLCSERPLRAEELCHALGVEIGTTELDPENIPTLRILLSSCLGLLAVEASSSTVRLVHFTLQKHLLNDPTLFHSSHSTIAEVCLTYLNFRSVRDLSPTLNSAPSTMPLLEYASFYWGVHAKRGITEEVKILGLKLLDGHNEHISARLRHLGYPRGKDYCPYFDEKGELTRFSGLGQVVFFATIDAIVAILEMKEEEVNAIDWSLIRAVVGGREAVVKMLLEREGVNPTKLDAIDGRTPLSLAAITGHEGVVKMFLEREDVNLNHADNGGQTPLWWAAVKGHDGVVKMLLEREGINPDQRDTEIYQTPLSWAAANGNEGVVKMLLEREEVNPNHAGQDGETPLSLAALKGHEGVVKIFLERRDVNPNHADKDGKTPLLSATVNGHEGIVKILLEREGINPNHVDNDGQTPLFWAVLSRHEGVVRMLLRQEDINPNHGDIKQDSPPLLLAAMIGHEGIVKILLEREGVNPNHVDNDGQTPLFWAALNGHEGVVRMLLEREEVNPDQPDIEYGQTPLSLAAANGHEGVVRILSEREDFNPNQPDTKYGRTPLSWAAQNGHEAVVMILLERGMSALLDHQNQSPLSLALPKGPPRVARILLERPDLDSNKASHGDYPSFSLPAQPRDESVVGMQPKSDDPNTDFNSQPQLLPAARNERARLLDCQNSISESTDHNLQPNSPGGPDFFPSNPEGSSTAEGKLRSTSSTPNRSSRLSSTGVLFLLLLFVFSLLSTRFLPR